MRFPRAYEAFCGDQDDRGGGDDFLDRDMCESQKVLEVCSQDFRSSVLLQLKRGWLSGSGSGFLAEYSHSYHGVRVDGVLAKATPEKKGPRVQ